MEVLAVIGVLSIVAIVASAIGQAWAPMLIGLGFAGWGGICFFGGYESPWPEFGLIYFGGAGAEFVAARELWLDRGKRPAPARWRAIAALVGLAGTVGFVALLIVIAAALAGFYSQL